MNLKALVANAAGMFFRARTGEDGLLFEFVSDGARELLGLSPESLVDGRVKYASLVHPSDLERVREEWRRAVEGRVVASIEYRLRLPDGRIRWVRAQAVPLFGPDQQLATIEGFITDVSRCRLLESRDAIRSRLDRLVMAGRPLEVLIECLVTCVDEQLESSASAVHLAEPSRRLRLASAALPETLRSSLVAVDPNADTPIAVAARTGQPGPWPEPAAVGDTPSTDTPLSAHGFRSAWTEPIRDCDDQVRGAWTLFVRHGGPPPAEWSEHVQWAGRLATTVLQRRESQAALAASESFRAATLNALNSRIAVVDTAGVIVATNRAWKDFAVASGLEWASVSEGTSYFSVCERAVAAGDEDARKVIASIGRVLGGETECAEVEYECHSSTEKRWFRCRITQFPGSTARHVVFAHEDVTETHLALEAARRSEAHFHSLFEFAPDALVMVDDAGLIAKVNRQAELLFGWPRADLAGRTIETLMPPNARERHIQQRQRFLQAQVPRAMGQDRGILRAMRRDGSVFPADISLGPLETKSGRMVLAAIRDVTDRTRAERRMREALTALDAMNDAAVIFEVEQFRLDFVNEAAVRLLGGRREDLLGKSLEDFMSRRSAEEFRAAMLAHVGSEAAASTILTRFGNADGTETPVEVSAQPVDGDDGQVRCIAVIRDITQRVAEERAARRSQRLESIGTLAGGVAHDLNNALTPIVMGLDALRTDYPTESDLIQTMETSARRAANMVRQLLTFAKGAEGARVVFSLSPLLIDLEAIIRATFPKSIRIRIVAEDSLPPVLGDSTQIHQVLMNLCVNARDAMPEGGDLLIEAKRAMFRQAGTTPLPIATQGEFVYLRISDTGAGIPPQHMDKIFDPFFTTKGPDKGTGLGLSTALGIVRAHGGLMDVDSSPRRGTTFHVYLAIATEPVSSELGRAGLQTLRGDGRVVLMVDDEPSVRHVGRHTLETLGFTVVLADDGLDALFQIAESRVDFSLVITDLSMPELDGMAFIRRLRRLRPELPVVAMSGHFTPSVCKEIGTLARVRRLDKPFSRDELAVVLQSLLAGSPGETR